MNKLLIYVVDDEPLISRLVQINLERAGYEVKSALDGLEALQTIQQRTIRPDLILLDVMMPFMDGFEFLNQLKADFEFSNIPVIIMTARSRDEDILIGRDLGAQQYLTKPINPTELVAMVRKALGELDEPQQEEAASPHEDAAS